MVPVLQEESLAHSEFAMVGPEFGVILRWFWLGFAMLQS